MSQRGHPRADHATHCRRLGKPVCGRGHRPPGRVGEAPAPRWPCGGGSAVPHRRATPLTRPDNRPTVCPAAVPACPRPLTARAGPADWGGHACARWHSPRRPPGACPQCPHATARPLDDTTASCARGRLHASGRPSHRCCCRPPPREDAWIPHTSACLCLPPRGAERRASAAPGSGIGQRLPQTNRAPRCRLQAFVRRCVGEEPRPPGSPVLQDRPCCERKPVDKAR